MKRKLRNKFLLSSLIVGASAIAISGCGSGGSANSGGTSNSGKASNSSDSGTITITLLKHFNSFEKDYNQELISGFEKTHPNVKVQIVTPQTGSTFTKFLTLSTGGKAPDVYLMAGTYAAQLLNQGVLSPVDYSAMGVSGLNQLESQYISGDVNAYMKDGKLYGIPEEVSNYQMWINKGAFEAAGISQLPTTWAQVEQDAAKMSKVKNGQVQQEEIALPINFPAAEFLIVDAIARENGQGLFNSNGTVSNLTSPSVVKAFQMLQDLVYKYHAFYPSLNGTTTASERVLYGEGKAAILLDAGSWYAPTLQQQYSNVWKSSDVEPYPTFQGKPSQNDLYGYAYVVPKASKNQKLAWEYVHFLQQEGGTAFKLGLYSGLKSLASTPTAAQTKFWNDKWVPSMAKGQYEVSLVHGTQVDDIIGQAYDQILLNHADVQQTLADAQSKIQPLLNK